MLVSVISVVVTLAATAQGAPQSGYIYPPAEVDFALIPEETNLEEQQLVLTGEENIVFPDAEEKESAATTATDHHSHAGDHDHDHDHHHHDHHLGLEWLREAVPGEPGVDYPIYWQAPRTSFDCRRYHEGYYADMETGCQVFHVCNNRGDRTFLCPNGTIFNQEHFTCQWWFNVECSRAQDYYRLNVNIGAVAQETRGTSGEKGAGQRKQPRRPIPEVVVENTQEPVQQEEVSGEDVPEINPPQVEQLDLVENEVVSVNQDEDQPSVYVTEQSPVSREDEQEEEPATEIPSDYISSQNEIAVGVPQEDAGDATQEPENPSVQIVSDFPSAEQVPENPVIRTEADIPVQENEDEQVIESETETPSEYSSGQDDITEGVPREDADAATDKPETPFVQTVPDFPSAEQISENQVTQTETEIPAQENDDEQEVGPITETPSEYLSGQDKITDGFPREDDDVATQEPEYPVIQTETNIIPAQGEARIPSQDEESSSFSQENKSTEQGSDLYSVQDTESPFIQEETVYASNSEEVGTTDFQQEGNTIPAQQDNVVIPTLNQQQNDTTGSEEDIDFIPAQQENDFDTVENSQEEDNLASGETESEVSLPKSETSSASEQDFTTAQQETVLLPTQEGHGLVPVQYENDVVPGEQEVDYSPVNQGAGSSFLPEDSTLITDEQEGDFIPVDQEGSFVPDQVDYHGSEEGYTAKEEEDNFLPSEQDVLFPEQPVSHTGQVQEEDSFSIVPQELNPSSEDQGAEAFPIYQVSEHQEADSSVLQGESDFTSFKQETDPTNLQDDTTFSIHQENDYVTTVQPEFVPEYQESEVKDGQQEPSLLPEQPVTDYASGPQGTEVLTENEEELPIQQEETYDGSFQQETGLVPEEESPAPVEEQVTVLPNPQAFDNAYDQQQGDIFQEDKLVTDPISEDGDYYNSQEIAGHVDNQQTGTTSFDQQETDITAFGENQFNTFQDETAVPSADIFNSQVPVQQSVNLEIAQQDTGYEPEEYGGSYSQEQTEVPVTQPQQEYSFVPEQQEVSYSSGQQYPINNPEQQETDQVNYQQTNEQNFISQGFASDGNFIQQDSGVDFVPEEQQYGVAQENQGYIPISQENVDDPSQDEQGFLSEEHIPAEISVEEEPVDESVQEENVLENSVEAKPDLNEIVSEVLPQADSTFESPSAIIPEIPVLYGVPLHSSQPVNEVDSSLEILLPSEVQEEITDENNFIVPGVTTFPGSSAQEPVNEVIPEQFHSEKHEGDLYPVLPEHESPQLSQLPEENLDTTEIDQVEPVTDLPANPNLFQFPEEVDVRRNEVNLLVDTYTNDAHQTEYDLTTTEPVLFEDDTIVDVNREISGHFEITDDLATAKSQNADDGENYEIATEIPSLTVNTDESYFVNEPTETDTSYPDHESPLYSEVPKENFATELDTYDTTISSLYGNEYEADPLVRSETPEEIKKSNHTGNATNVSDHETDVQLPAIQEKTGSFVESQENSHEGDDSQEPVTVFPTVLNEIRTTAHEDPVLSLVYKASETPLSKNQEDTTLSPYNEEEDNAFLPRDEEEVAGEGEPYGTAEVTTLSPAERDFVTLPFVDTEEENKIHSSDEEYQEKFTSFPQLVDLDKLFGIPPQEKYEARSEGEPFTLFETDDSQTLYETPRLPLENPPSNHYLPPY
ncbi:protein P200-like [Macrobrachium rosenbergii]|uniref:protein P200-like n=1 Tax=Macrobrachium rosenbergii TaxID=79674 RepID=UPI0034D3FDE4